MGNPFVVRTRMVPARGGLAGPPCDARERQGDGLADGSTSQDFPRPLHAARGISADVFELLYRS